MINKKITPCLWFDKNAEEAANFYAATFPDSEVTSVNRSPGDYPSGKAGDVLTVEFTVLGSPFVGLNGGPQFKFSEAVSFMVYTEDQAETDRYWNAIVDNGGEENVCGWCKDKFGLFWQITPRRLMELTTSKDTAKAKRAFDAMLKQKKIIIADIEAAAADETVNA
jgi:predicted 3-demethylubiquinone-9 3-methyltransferase (glyoxalase superfamily)